MKYKCKKCGAEFDVTYEAICPKCRASSFDVEPLSKYLRAQAVQGDEA